MQFLHLPKNSKVNFEETTFLSHACWTVGLFSYERFSFARRLTRDRLDRFTDCPGIGAELGPAVTFLHSCLPRVASVLGDFFPGKPSHTDEGHESL